MNKDRANFIDGTFDTGSIAGVIAERQRILELIERLAKPTADKKTMTIDRTELLKAILK
jgi:mevalonate pyrophosphate decarboxylase